MDMATTTCATLASQSSSQPFAPSPWGEFFLDHQPCTPSQLLLMKRRAQATKEVVRQSILEAAASNSLVRKLELVNTLQWIGVDYHYKQEIDELLRQVYDGKDGASGDLYVTSLRFYLLRKHGYNVSSDVFLKFTDEKGNISSDDVNCLMTLYDAAHLRTHGEQILDSIITFNRDRLGYLAKTNLEPYLVNEVRMTLETPRFRRVKRVEAHRYISVYEKKVARDETILELAKLDYNILQALYCEELKELTIWWKDFQSRADLRFARDRMVELHFWMLGILYEPFYSYSRIMMTKFLVFASLFDDLCDSYNTAEESDMFTRAIERWDEQTGEQLPAHLKAIFIHLLHTTNKIEEDLKLQGNKHTKMIKKMVIDTARFYHDEVTWREEHYIPATIEEHLQISLRSTVCMQITNMAFISLGDVTSREAVEWAFSFPKIIIGISVVGRIGNDIMSHEREQALGQHVVSTVQTCMKQYGVTVEEANAKLRAIIEGAWMDIVEDCLDQKHPMVLLERAVDVARTMDFIYKRDDAYTFSDSLKDVITSMYVNSIP